MARKTKQDAEKTYLALLDAAADLFLQKGTSRTTLQEIAAHAGLTRGAIYWHFKGKDEIVRQIWEAHAQSHHDRFISTLCNLPDEGAARIFRELLHDILSITVNDHRAGRAISIVLHIVEFTTEETELQHYLGKRHDDFVSAMITACRFLQGKHALKAGIPPELAAKGTLCYVFGLVNQYLSPHPFADLKLEGEELLDTYLDAVLAADAAAAPISRSN